MTTHRTWILLATIVCAICCKFGQTQERGQAAPKPDYITTDITFKAHDDVGLFGRLVLPKSKQPRAIVLFVQTAEGATVDQKRSLGRGKTFNYFDLYRKTLTAMDIGFFSYEGRGIRMGDKPPRFEKIDWKLFNTGTLDNKVRDVLRAVETVRRQDGLDGVPVFLMGASEGTLLCAEAAAKKPKGVAGLVLYGVLVNNLRETFKYIMSEGSFLEYRVLDEDKDGAVSKAEWDRVVKHTDISKADFNKDGKFTVDDFKVVNKKYLDAVDGDDYEVLQAWAKAHAGLAIPEGWFKDHFAHKENWHFLSRLDMPVGCFHGIGDRMTPVGPVRELEKKAKKAGLDKMEFHYFEGLGHTLGITRYFINGKMPAGHRAIFKFIDRIAPPRKSR